MDIYLVGGAVRDRLLGKPVHDRDWVVVGATPEEMLARGFRQVGADFPVFLHPDTQEEYALARTERKQGHGYHGFRVYSSPDVTLEQDLERRDLTINAMAESEDGAIVDPFGGQRDLEQRILRHISPAFKEDPLRILRVARFAARLAPLGFEVAEKTSILMQEMVKQGEASHLVPERVWQETQRALHENRPRVYFEVLRQCQALAVIMPELDTLLSTQTHAGQSALPVTGESVLATLAEAGRASAETSVLFASLCFKLEPKALATLCHRLKVPNGCRELAVLANQLAADVHRAPALSANRVLDILNTADSWRRPERFTQLLLVCEAEARAIVGSLSGYRPTDFLRQALQEAQSVQARDFLAQGISGKAIGAAIQRERLTRIEALPRPTSQ